jgi:hypothetical protein
VPPQSARPSDQRKALDLAESFREHDLAALGRLTSVELADQQQARELLWHYVDEIWHYIKDYLHVHAPAQNPAYSAVAGMRDLAGALGDNAAQVVGEMEGDLGD